MKQVALASLMLTSCTSGAATKIVCDTNDANVGVLASQIVRESGNVAERIKTGEARVGFGGMLTKRFAGSAGYNGLVELTRLRGLIGSAVAAQQAAEYGAPLVSPKTERGCELLADSVASLDAGQSAGQILDNLSIVRHHFAARSSNHLKGESR